MKSGFEASLEKKKNVKSSRKDLTLPHGNRQPELSRVCPFGRVMCSLVCHIRAFLHGLSGPCVHVKSCPPEGC